MNTFEKATIKLLDYLWADELKDYERHCLDNNTGEHIFESMLKIKESLEGVSKIDLKHFPVPQ